MPAETLTTSLNLTATDYAGNSYIPALLAAQYTSQSKISFREITIPTGGTPVDLWDPTTWTGYSFTTFKAFVISIADVGPVTPGVNTQAIELEMTCNLAVAQGFVITLGPGDWYKIPSPASYRSPANQNDMWTTSTAGLINRLRARNQGASVAVKASMWMVDST